MVHKLEIDFEFQLDSDLRHVLASDEVVRGEQFGLVLSLTNIGENKFPGGDISNLNIEFRSYGGMQFGWHTGTQSITCPEIEPGDTVTLESIEADPLTEGAAVINLTIIANDGDHVDHYRPNDETSYNEWQSIIYVVDRFSAMTLALLTEINNSLKKPD